MGFVPKIVIDIDMIVSMLWYNVTHPINAVYMYMYMYMYMCMHIILCGLIVSVWLNIT